MPAVKPDRVVVFDVGFTVIHAVLVAGRYWSTYPVAPLTAVQFITAPVCEIEVDVNPLMAPHNTGVAIPQPALVKMDERAPPVAKSDCMRVD